MKLKTETEAGLTMFLDVDADDQEVYYLHNDGGDIPDDMQKIVEEFELIGVVMESPVAGGGTGWNSPMIERLERRRTELKDALMEQCKKEIEND